MHSVRTTGRAFDHLFGQDLWQYLASRPAYARLFDDAMTSLTAGVAAAVAAALDFGAVGTLVDVGGGHGELMAVLLQANPRMRGVVFDLPHVVVGTAAFLARAGVLSRCEVVGASFFEGVPHGGDASLLKNLIHDWDDEPATAILRSWEDPHLAPFRSVLMLPTLFVSIQSQTVSTSQVWSSIKQRALERRALADTGALNTIEPVYARTDHCRSSGRRRTQPIGRLSGTH